MARRTGKEKTVWDEMAFANAQLLSFQRATTSATKKAHAKENKALVGPNWSKTRIENPQRNEPESHGRAWTRNNDEPGIVKSIHAFVKLINKSTKGE